MNGLSVWRDHVAWRLWSTDFARRRHLSIDRKRRNIEAFADARCVHCHEPNPQPAYKTCPTCRSRRRAAQMVAQEKRNAMGLCARCPGSLDRQGVLCSGCVKKQAKRGAKVTMRRRESRSVAKADGRPCTKCRKPVEDERFRHCVRCRASSTRAAKKRARKRVMTGACPKCGKPRDGDTVVCRSCLAHQRAKYHARGTAL